MNAPLEAVLGSGSRHLIQGLGLNDGLQGEHKAQELLGPRAGGWRACRWGPPGFEEAAPSCAPG